MPRRYCVTWAHSLRADNLTKQAGLRVVDTRCDSKVYQFFDSEQLKRNIAKTEHNSIYVNPEQSIFTPLDLLQYREKATAANRAGSGDQVAYFLQHANGFR